MKTLTAAALSLALLFTPSLARAGGPAEPAAPADGGSGQAAGAASAGSAPLEGRYAEREAAAPELAEFSGGGRELYIGGGVLVVALLVVLIVVLL